MKARREKRRSARRWVLGTLLGALVPLCLVAALVIVVDPFQHYRAASFYIPLVDRQIQNYINLGIARNYPYDTLSLGSSMTENTRTEDIESAFGGTAVQLPFRGGNLVQFRMAMEVAFRKHALRRVILCLDDYAFADNPHLPTTDMPMYLYDENPLNDVYYWFNADVLQRIADVYEYNRYALDKPDTLNLNELYNWGDNMMYGRALTFANFTHYEVPEMPQYAADALQEAIDENLRLNLLALIQTHPETEFVFYFPPYSTLHWYHARLYGHVERHLYARAAYARALLAQPNVRLFDFQTNEDWIDEYEYFTDFTHYGGEVNTALTQAMGEGAFEVHDAQDVLANNEIIRDFAFAFVPPDAQELALMREEAQAQMRERLLLQ